MLRALLSTILLTVGMPLAAAAPTRSVVLRASGPIAARYPAGRVLGEAGPVDLAASDSLTLLDSRGTRVLRGPGNFALAGGESIGRFDDRLAVLWKADYARANIGAVRSLVVARGRSPNVWLLDTRQDGAFCVADPAALRLWRGSVGPATTRIADAAGHATILDWGATDSVRPWPAALPLVPGATYTITTEGALHTVRIARAGLAAASLEETVAALAGAGCDTQAGALAASVDILAMMAP